MTTKTKPASDPVVPDRQSLIPSAPMLDDLAGMDAARTWGLRMARHLKAYTRDEMRWRDIAPGCVLHGPPGTGKTTFGKALAATCGLPLVETTFGEWQGSGEGHLGSLLKAMADVFAIARAVKPCILFIDELDSIPSRGSTRHNDTYWMAVTNELLKALDKIGQAEGVVVIGACNHPDRLDPAVVRSGRMDTKIKIDFPDVTALAKILEYHLTLIDRLALMRETKRSDLSEIAKYCVGMSGADIARLVREARAKAGDADRYINVADIMASLGHTDHAMTSDERRRLAVYEAGCGVARYRLGLASEITMSIASRNGSDCAPISLDPRTATRNLIDRRITALLAGRAAEEIFCGSVSGGAVGGEHSALGQATRLALEAVATLGLSETKPLGWYPGDKGADRNRFPQHVIEEVDAMLAERYEAALALIGHEWDFVNLVSDALARNRALSHREFVLLDRRPRSEAA